MKKTGLVRIMSIFLVMSMCLGACGSKNGDGADGKGTLAGAVSEANKDIPAADDLSADAKGTAEVTAEGSSRTGASEAAADGANAAASDTAREENGSSGTTLTDSGALMEKPAEGHYIELAINVYYNDSKKSYSKNESGKSIFVTGEGQYELSFDCAADLSDKAVEQGVNSLSNLTAIYITDMESIRGEGKSVLKSCNIMYDKVIVDGKELTVTLEAPKAAFKSNGLFDTNDPINGWDGSCVAEVDTDTANHVANFNTVEDPTRITVLFTLSDMVWDDSAAGAEVASTDAETGSGSAASAGTSTPAADSTAQTSDNEGFTGPSGVTYVNDSVFSNLDLTNMNALELSEYMGIGINLGNTFEATASGKNGNVKVYETAWGQPVTTQKMIEGYKRAGFDTLRIPVSWTNTMDFEKGDFEINRDYLERVGTIVKYAIDAEMFVIVNDHWDRGWWAAFGSDKPEDVELAWKIYTEIWTQVATYFKDYSDMLILESANEELGNNLNNNSSWPSSGHLTTEGKYETTNAINQKFVDIVRSTGGNNTDRFLLIAGYNTNINDTLNSRFRMPADTAKDKLFVSVHYYDPSNYCLAGDSGNLSKWGIKSEYEHMDKMLASLEKFTKEGYGVIIGESGALATWQNNTPVAQPNTCEWESYFMDNCAIYNYVGCFWDTNGTYNKTAAKIRVPEVAEVFAMRSYAQEAAYGDGYLDMVRARMAAQYEAAPVMWEGVETYEAGTPVAWIMWNGGAGTYSVGDTFNPADNTAGITAHNAVIEGSGEYEVSLDFAKGNSGLTFGALAIADGELLYPNSVIIIEQITYDGKPVDLISTPYTTSDDGKCTRVNLINEWVTERPKGARALGNLANATATILDKTQIIGIHNITIKFRFVAR